MNNTPTARHNCTLSSMNPKQFLCTPTWHGMYGEGQGRVTVHVVTVSSLWHTQSAQTMRQLTCSRGSGWWLWGLFTPCSPNSTCHQILEARWHRNRWRGHTGQSWGRNTWRRMQKAGNRRTAWASTMVCCDGRVQDWGLQHMTVMLFYGSVSTAMVKKCQTMMGKTNHFQPFIASPCALRDLIPCRSLTSAHNIDSTLACWQFKTLSSWVIVGIKTQGHWRVQVLFCYSYLPEEANILITAWKHTNSLSLSHCSSGWLYLNMLVLLSKVQWQLPVLLEQLVRGSSTDLLKVGKLGLAPLASLQEELHSFHLQSPVNITYITQGP
jgi:hypothetical protein